MNIRFLISVILATGVCKTWASETSRSIFYPFSVDMEFSEYSDYDNTDSDTKLKSIDEIEKRIKDDNLNENTGYHCRAQVLNLIAMSMRTANNPEISKLLNKLGGTLTAKIYDDVDENSGDGPGNLSLNLYLNYFDKDLARDMQLNLIDTIKVDERSYCQLKDKITPKSASWSFSNSTSNPLKVSQETVDNILNKTAPVDLEKEAEGQSSDGQVAPSVQK